MDTKTQAVIHAYRSLYRAGLHAVKYSKPGRYILKETLELAFRKTPADQFHPLRIGNTLLFLENAARTTGVEHKVLKNLLHVRWWQRQKYHHPRP